MKRRGLGVNSALALAGDGASKASALIVIIIGARFLSVSQFAVLATGLAAAGLLASMLDLGSGMLLTRDGARTAARRGALFTGLLRARAPLVLALLFAAPLVGLALGMPLTALAVAMLALSSALSLSVLGLYRSCQNIAPEAIQKLITAILSVAGAALAALWFERADAVLGALALVSLATLVPLMYLAPRVADFGSEVRPLTALRMAAPIGLLALATVVYYRSGTLALATLAPSKQTAVFGVAASIAFGMLMLPNALTTALLPKLAAENDLDRFVACARRALAWTLLVAVLVSAAAALVVPFGLPLVLGSAYADAAAPFVLLCAGIPLIAASGVIGTTLLSMRLLRPLALQVAASLVVNLLALALLVPPLGAIGAAVATVACELVGLVLLTRAARSALPGLIALHPSPAQAQLPAPPAVAT
jgi:O-antigen/teichoic acid export membrane protein